MSRSRALRLARVSLAAFMLGIGFGCSSQSAGVPAPAGESPGAPPIMLEIHRSSVRDRVGYTLRPTAADGVAMEKSRAALEVIDGYCAANRDVSIEAFDALRVCEKTIRRAGSDLDWRVRIVFFAA